MLASWLFGLDDIFTMFGFPIICVFIVHFYYKHMREYNPERWERVKRGEDEHTEQAKKFVKGGVLLTAKIISKILKK